jgi:aminocarboxymuconate-semialdehyde decarboxylase
VTTTVDVHAHHLPPGLPDLATVTGDGRWPRLEVDGDRGRIMRGGDLFRRVGAACFDVDARVAELDRAGVDRQVVSPVPVTLVDWAPAPLAARFLAAQNDALAEAAAGSHGRLVPLGAVPLQDTAAAIAELERLRRDLGMAGVEIAAMAGGRELDDPALEPFWAAAEAERVPVFVHPAHQATATRRHGPLFEFGVGMHTDTSLAAAALVYGGVLERHPDLHVALSHGCGAFPWTHPRLRYFATLDGSDGARFDELVRLLWADCLVFDPAHVPLLVERFGADHLLYGTDHPFLPDGFDGPRAVLADATAAGADLDEGVLGANALAFLGIDDPPE